MENEGVVDVSIMGREYKVRCEPSESKALHRSARYVEKQMQKIGQNAMSYNTDRIAVVTALNIANDFLKEQAINESSQIDQKIRRIRNKIQQALATKEEIGL